MFINGTWYIIDVPLIEVGKGWLSQLDIYTRKWNLTSSLTFYLYLRINKVWNVHTMKYYSAMKMNVTTWKNLKHNVKNFGYWKTKIWLYLYKIQNMQN